MTFVKGQSGNPNGRPPKGYSLTEAMRDMLNKNPEYRQAIITKAMERALKGDKDFIKLLWQYMDGMPMQGVDLTTGGLPMPLLGGKTDVPVDDSDQKAAEPEKKD